MKVGQPPEELREQVNSAISEVEIEGRLAWKRNDMLVFTPHGGEREITGQFWSDEGVGVIVYGWRDGRKYLVGSQSLRAESDYERQVRERDGWCVEEIAGRKT